MAPSILSAAGSLAKSGCLFEIAKHLGIYINRQTNLFTYYLSILVKDIISRFPMSPAGQRGHKLLLCLEDLLSCLTEVVPFRPDEQFLVLSENEIIIYLPVLRGLEFSVVLHLERRVFRCLDRIVSLLYCGLPLRRICSLKSLYK